MGQTPISSQSEIAENVAASLSRLKRLLPVKLIVLADPRHTGNHDTCNGYDLLIVHEGLLKAGVYELVKEALDIKIEPHLVSASDYAQDKESLDTLVAKGMVLYQEGTGGSRTRPARRGWRKAVRWTGNGLVAIGLLMILSTGAYYGYSYYSLAQLETTIEEPSGAVEAATEEEAQSPEAEDDTSDLASFLASSPGAARAGAPRASSIGDEVPWEGLSFWPLGIFPPTRVIIPSIGVDSKVTETGIVFEEGEWQWERPKNAVGHLKGTGDPGDKGNIVLSGHISSPRLGEGEVFKRLPDVKVGDVVIVYTQARAFTYQISSKKVVLPTEINVLKPTPDETLTLITCVPDFIYSHRLIVTARRVESG